jgi:hypothetical protein
MKKKNQMRTTNAVHKGCNRSYNKTAQDDFHFGRVSLGIESQQPLPDFETGTGSQFWLSESLLFYSKVSSAGLLLSTLSQEEHILWKYA